MELTKGTEMQIDFKLNTPFLFVRKKTSWKYLAGAALRARKHKKVLMLLNVKMLHQNNVHNFHLSSIKTEEINSQCKTRQLY